MITELLETKNIFESSEQRLSLTPGQYEEQKPEKISNDFLKIITEGLTQLGHTADGSSLAFLNLKLLNKNLVDVGFIDEYRHIQVLDVSHNHINDLSALSSLKYLISINASHNKLEKVLCFDGSSTIRKIDFSYNLINDIGDLSCYPLLNTLLLDFNQIREITGIQKCSQLCKLSFSHNSIKSISGLEKLQLLSELDISYNEITQAEGLEDLQSLQHLNLASNLINGLKGFSRLIVLKRINLQDNQVHDISELDHIKHLKMLQALSLLQNPIQASNNYRLSVVFKVQTLMELDLEAVTIEEKVEALNFFSPNKKLLAALDHSYNIMQGYSKNAVLYNSVLPSGQPYPILILAGPKGLRKKSIGRALCQDFPKSFGLGLGHSTKVHRIEMNEKVPFYHYITEERFHNKRLKGDFIHTCSLDGDYFGISCNEVENIAKQHLICILTLSLEGVLSFKYSHFQPRYVLLLPEDKKKYDTSLSGLNQWNEFVEFHRDHPGCFDTVIVTDDFGERYNQLKSAVVEFFGIKSESDSKSSTSIERF